MDEQKMKAVLYDIHESTEKLLAAFAGFEKSYVEAMAQVKAKKVAAYVGGEKEAGQMNRDTHFYLYAKGHYQEGNVVQDVRKLAANWANVDPKYTTIANARRVLTEIATRELKRSWNWEFLFPRFVLDVSEKNGVVDEIVFRALLRILRFADLHGLDLGEPDSSILPLKVTP